MSQTQLFAVEHKEAAPGVSERAAGLRDRLALARELELKGQERMLSDEIATVENIPRIQTPALSRVEMRIWREWLPTAYVDDPRPFYRERKLSAYAFDDIPSPVLRKWKSHKESGLFQRFEIWTPERFELDPVLVGVNGEAHYLLARWGESDANLLSFDDIKAELTRRWHKRDGSPTGECLLLSLFVALVLVVASVTFIPTASVPHVAASVYSGIFLCSAAVFFSCRGMIRRWKFNNDSLMRAIVNHQTIRRDLEP